MASLAGEFAGLLRVTVPDAKAGALEAALADLADEGLQVLVKGGSDDARTDGPLLSLELVGQDRPGIVREISLALASRGINVEELESSVSSAPMSGENLFHVHAQIRVPEDVSHEDLRSGLESIAEDLMVDLRLSGEC